MARGGRHTDDENIAQVLAELLERAGQGPDEPGTVHVPDGYGPVPGHGPVPAAADGATEFDPFAGADALDLAALGPLTVLEVDQPSLYAPSPLTGGSAPGPDPGLAASAGTGAETGPPLADLGDLEDSLDSTARLLLDLPAETDSSQETTR
ncbi:hypothetical protein [Streptomyces griseoluteus]|uniref:hypothetical protein n=1 Tax=Streptomyces griseoluteus TaxID=29306 RepID=UPI0036F61813